MRKNKAISAGTQVIRFCCQKEWVERTHFALAWIYIHERDFVSAREHIEHLPRNLFYYDYMDECVQLVTLTALLSEEGSGSVFGARNRMEEIISCIKNINSYTSDRLSVEAVVTCSGMTVIDGTVLRGDSGSDNSCEIVYIIQLK